ncbi:MAG TPA: hypothetical protein DCP28_37530, partial [Cytophagales bacterium]|nr:hypothetical protein [Cytophagales bacterium]
ATGRQGVVLWRVDAVSDALDGYFYSTGAYDMAFPSLCLVGEDPTEPEFFVNFLYSSESHYPGMGALFVGLDGTTGGLIETEQGTGPVDLNASESLEYWGTTTGMVRQHTSSTTQYWQLGMVAENGGYTPVVAQLEVGDIDLP